MRLPFGLGRRSSSGDGASGGSSDAGSPTVSRSASGGSGPVRAPFRAWASLPPIQRAAGPMPLVAAPAAFAGGLPGTQGLPPIVQQLGHEVSTMATPGLVVARVRAVEQSSSTSIPAPAQRRGSRTSQRQVASSATYETVDAPEPEAFTAPVVTSAAPLASSSSPSSTGTRTSAAPTPVVARSAATSVAETSLDADGDDDALGAASVAAPDMAPVRTLPTVSRSAVRVPDRPLTSAAAVVRPVAQRSHAGHSHATAAADGTPAAAAALPAPSGGMRRVPSSTVISRSSMPTASRQATTAPTSTPAVTSSTTANPEAASTALPALAPTRRGVGEPTSLPASARPVGAPPAPIVSRSTMAGPMPLASSSLRTTIQRAGGDGDEVEGDENEDAPVQRSMSSPLVARTPSLPTLPVLTVSRSARDVASSGGAAASAHASAATAAPTGPTGAAGAAPASGPAGGSAPLERSSASAPTIRPIAAHNPLRPSVALQRDADDDATGGDDDSDGGLPSPWWAPASEGAAAVSAGPSAGGRDSGPPVQRSPFAGLMSSPSRVSAMAAAGGSATGGPTWAAPSVQRSSRTAAPAPRLPLATQAAPATSPASSGSTPNWSAPGATVVFPQRGITSDPAVQTSRSSSPTYPPNTANTTVQREGGTTSTTTSSTSTTSPAAPAAAKGHSERELDDLARQLFGRIRTRLRADLLQDREAAGFTFDNV